MIKEVQTGAGVAFGTISPFRRAAAEAASSIGGTEQAGGFGAVVGKMATEMAASLQGGEAAAIGGLSGTVATPQVVEAILAAEQTLHTAVAVRDKAAAAYNELINMQI